MAYGWKIEYDGIDITDKCGRFDIAADLDQYAREVTVEISDPAFYASLDFSTIPSEPLLEVFTKVDAAWISQGRYFVERPALSSDINQDVINGLWGRNETARLGSPFAQRVSKMWTADTSFFAIVAEMCALAGLLWDASQSTVDDFYVFAYIYQAENAFPIDVIAELCELTGAIATCDRNGNLIITASDYAPASADVTITDDDWQSIAEQPEWPDFGNRVRIIPSGSLAGYAIALTVPDPCLPADGASRARLYAQVTDAEGEPVNEQTVAWTTDAAAASLEAATSQTREALMPEEELRAASRYEITLAFAPAEILGVWAYADFRRANDLAAAGYSIDGRTVTLAEPLAYCDQLVRVRYTVAGMAINHLTAGSEIEDVTVSAEIGGERAKAELFVGNDCRCPAGLTLEAIPSSIELAGLSQLLVCGEEGGGPVMDRVVALYETGAQLLGTLSWTRARLREARVYDEATAAENPAAGVTQCELAHPAKDGATVSVRRVDANGLPTGGNLFSSRSGQTVILSTFLATGTNLAATYTALGCAYDRYRGEIAGTAHFKARMESNREEGVEATTRVRITDPTDPLDVGTGDDDPGTDGYGGSGGDEGLETDPSNCMKDDGSLVVCSGEGDGWYSAEVCCKSGGVYGCFERSQCEDSHNMDLCTPALTAAQDPDYAPTERFEALKVAGCSCEQICQAEFARLGTTQGYDDGSYRTIEELVAEEDGLTLVEGGDNTAYWEAYNTRKDQALADCIGDCNLEPLECHPDNPETVGAVGVEVAVIGGRAPFTWSVAGTGFSMSADETETRGNTLIPDPEEACGAADITVTDGAGQTVTCSVRSTNGYWRRIEDTPCKIYGAPTSGVAINGTGELISGKYKVIEEKYFQFKCATGGAWFDTCSCNGCKMRDYYEDVCITGHECPKTDPYAGWPLVTESKICCYYVDPDYPQNVTWCKYPRWRAQYEWSC